MYLKNSTLEMHFPAKEVEVACIGDRNGHTHKGVTLKQRRAGRLKAKRARLVHRPYGLVVSPLLH